MRPLFFKPIKRWPAELAVLMLILILAGTTKLAHATEHTISEHVRGAKSYTLSDNDTVQVTLSGVDLNRLVVSGDVITNVHCPGGFCVVDKKPAGDGSILLSINTQQDAVSGERTKLAPFTFFVDTEQGRHFGILAIPKAIPAVTALFTLKENQVAQMKQEANSEPFITRLSELMKRAIVSHEQHRPLTGFAHYPIGPDTASCRHLKPSEKMRCQDQAKHHFIHGARKALNAVPREVYEGPTQSIVVYRLINQTDHDVPLTPSQWYVEGLQGEVILPNVASLAPGGQAWLYQIVTNTGTE